MKTLHSKASACVEIEREDEDDLFRRPTWFDCAPLPASLTGYPNGYICARRDLVGPASSSRNRRQRLQGRHASVPGEHSTTILVAVVNFNARTLCTLNSPPFLLRNVELRQPCAEQTGAGFVQNALSVTWLYHTLRSSVRFTSCQTWRVVLYPLQLLIIPAVLRLPSGRVLSTF